MTLDAAALARILLLQNMISQLADQESIFSFVCRGLEEIPGVTEATYLPERSNNSTDQNNAYFPLQLNNSLYGEICISLSCQDDFKPYQSYISNLCFMVAVILEERRQNQLINQHQQLLEQQVNERTKELEMEVQERRVAEERALQAKKKAELYLDISEAIIVELGRFGEIRVINKQGCEILGYKQSDLLGKDWIELCIPLHIQPAVQNAFSKAMEGQGEFDEYFENEIVGSNGKRHLIAWHNVIQFDGKGQISGVLSSGIDITLRKQAEDERLEFESQLQQSRKIESIGQLAGGVAHDFNNMLGVILGHAEMALMKVPPSSPFISDLQEISNAANRAAELTRQLLTFARKQVIAPKVMDLNEAVGGTLKMLQRLIGENIQLSWNPASNLWPVMVDPSQVDQILANLCVNARDAIAGIGKISIRTENRTVDESAISTLPYDVLLGDYVLLSVSDDGCGMDPQAQSYIFEPFYTTKEVGSGTGLGLATVYGAVKQNHGFLTVYSEPGLGATFSIYFPRTSNTVDAKQESSEKPLLRGTETILLVEDDEMLLSMATSMLEESGYTVLAAIKTDLAQALAKEHPGPIHLLITDVIMPEMNGRELSAKLKPLRPEMSVLFISGYTAEIISTQGVVENDIDFLQKPFSFEALTAKVREVLDAQ